MSKYEKWIKSPSHFLSMTGYRVADFERLLAEFGPVHDAYLKKHELNGKPRKGLRRSVIYQNSPLPSHAERLCFILFYLKHNPVQEVQAEVFEMEQAQANVYIHGLHTILQLALEQSESMPARTEADLQTALENQSGKELLHDGSEREVPRPQDTEQQKAQYSGKKKKHTVKNAFLATMLGVIVYVSPTYAGSVHDKRMADSYSIPAGFRLWQDTGYQGYAPAGVEIVQPQKKPKGKDLTSEQVQQNRDISRVRVRIEHFIGGVKRYRMVKDECRAYKNDFRDTTVGICTGLYNFRVAHKLPQYPDFQ
ncbi:MAG: transposase family protein [Bacteroidia bacterium]